MLRLQYFKSPSVELVGSESVLKTMRSQENEGRGTLLAVHNPVAVDTHSLEWIPVSSQMAGRLDPPVLNCNDTE